MLEKSASNNRTLISVIMPAYNAEKYISEAIQSVINQTVADWELLVIDDCSTDRTNEIVEQFAKKDKRIILYKNIENMGVAWSRNRGLDLCKGEYVALLDSDDVWYRVKLEKQLEIQKQYSVDVVYCSYGLIDEGGNKICQDFLVPNRIDYNGLLKTSVISCSTAFFSRKIIDNYRFSCCFYHEDLIFWLDLLRDGCTAYGITEVLADYRLQKGSRSSEKIRSAINRWKVYRQYLGLSLTKTIYIFGIYAFAGWKKYQRVTP